MDSPLLERVWIPLQSLPHSACVNVNVSGTPKGIPKICQFTNDLLEMGIAENLDEFKFKSVVDEVLIRDMMTAKDYVSRAFIKRNLPLEMFHEGFPGYGVRPLR